MSLHELAIVVLSALLHAAWSVSIKGSRDPLAFNVLQTLPNVALAATLVPFVRFDEIPTALWPLLLGTSVAHAFYFYWMSRAYQLADLSLVYPIARSTPAFLPLAAVLLLGERISALGALGIATVVVGMWLVHVGLGLRLRAFLSPGTLFAYLTLGATVVYGLLDKRAMMVLEAATWTSPLPRAVFFYFALVVGHGILFVPLALQRVEPGVLGALARSQWRRVAAAIGFTFASYGLILEALRTAPVSYVVAARQVSVLFVVGMSVLWLGESPSRARMLGAGLTVAGVALLALAK
ncbi:MAG: EamA family transporter [Myxococcota bacterium]